MATRDGYRIGKLLVEKYGWIWDPDPDPEVIGDRWLVDTLTGEKLSPYGALEIETHRSGGATDTDSPVRELDPLKWSAMRAVEFSEAVPYCPFDGGPADNATCAEAFLHLSLLSKFCRERGVL